MGQDAAATVREIQRIRHRIDADLEELSEALPPGNEVVGRAVVAAVAGAVVVLGLWYLAHRLKVGRSERRVKSLVKEAIRELDGAGV